MSGREKEGTSIETTRGDSPALNSEEKLQGVTVTLGGGGAKGFVHLGILEELACRGIKIEAIVGTSIGAIIGAMFAYYSTTLFRDRSNPQLKAAKAVSNLFLTTSFWKYADFNILSALQGGIFRGQKLSEWLRQILFEKNQRRPIRFKEIGFPLTITATDAHAGRSLILNQDTEPEMFVYAAVRASMSIQWIFKEIELEINGQPILCWDGGTTGNCRFDLAPRLYPDHPIVASSLTYRGKVVSTRAGLLGAWMRPFKVLNHSTSILMRAVEEGIKDALPDTVKRQIIFVEPLLSYGSSVVGTYDFHLDRAKREILIENGRTAMAKALDDRCSTTNLQINDS